MNELQQAAQGLFDKLKAANLKIVFAESCTSGMVAAAMGQIPSVSNYLCGSAVTYREQTKMAWLGVDEQTLEQFSAESAETTESMARMVLQITPEADISVAVTGHLGPGAPADLDGKVFIAKASRNGDAIFVNEIKLRETARIERQIEAATATIRWALKE